MDDGKEKEEGQLNPGTDNRGYAVCVFNNDDTLSIRYNDMKPWKFWAAAKMLEMMGDQIMMQAQMEQMRVQQQQQASLEAIMRNPGGLRGPHS